MREASVVGLPSKPCEFVAHVPRDVRVARGTPVGERHVAEVPADAHDRMPEAFAVDAHRPTCELCGDSAERPLVAGARTLLERPAAADEHDEAEDDRQLHPGCIGLEGVDPEPRRSSYSRKRPKEG